MVEDKAHAIVVAIDLSDALAEGRDLRLQGFDQDVGQNRSLQMSTQALDQV